MSLATTDLATGITQLRSRFNEERLYARYTQTAAFDRTPLALGRLEGELFATAKLRKRQRRVQRWVGVAKAFGGVLILALTPIPDMNNTTRRTGYIVGSVFIATGMLRFGMAVKPTPVEKQWDAYDARFSR